MGVTTITEFSGPSVVWVAVTTEGMTTGWLPELTTRDV